MNLSNAARYAHRAKSSDDAQDVGTNVKKSIDYLIREIKELESRIARLERQSR